ncbi:glycoside hydrolase family 3 C-terminal domain-containing protein [Dermabacter sp. p3-SID358]|uniref:glycoside hydrolase family 3 protein n=1 Tax=Dermabacter sp. p3-SID358 TaxID=2916114 RepID=UPI0021A9354D|nr:glycoside hydrolase family 3 protein [Dermabacter sp. p3-SID358]MCT1866301.1 glycoside hydrolase family 3 C-terminal domain-containing protein [Dermabacter sp. p3-SID358]
MSHETMSQHSTAADDSADRRLDPRLAAKARELAAQGTVLLRNDGVLPLAPHSRVAVFGRTAKNWLAVGYGSGGDVNPPYITNLTDALRESDAVDVDEELASAYDRFSEEQPADPGTVWGKWPTHYPELELTDEQISSAADRNDLAILVIGRAAGEDRDAELAAGSYYLTEQEESLLACVTKAFDRTVVVVDAGNVMDLSWAERYDISALLIAWAGGMESGSALAEVLTGAREPGGRLTASIARRYEDAPTAEHFGDPDVTNYVEDVFVGYRYYETFAPEAAQFHFGEGLGYTSFTLGLGEFGSDATRARIEVTAKNTGERDGDTVVQAYLETPDGKLSQPSRRLAAFSRTGRVAAGESAAVSLEVDLRDFASYDDSGVTGHRSAYVLEPGTYRLHVGQSVKDTEVAGDIEVGELLVVREVEEASSIQKGCGFDRMILTRGDDGRATVGYEKAPEEQRDLARRILERLPEVFPEPEAGSAPSFDDVRAGKVSLEEFVATVGTEDLITLAYGDTTMDSPLGVRGNAGALGGVTESLRARGVAPAITTDGPSGLRISAFASLLPCGTALASTWNPEGVCELAALHAEEMLAKGSDILLSPGMNIQRDPLCGRNFEYFSEDPLLTGLMGAAVVNGVQSKGVAACPKHYAANNQEHNRIYSDSRVSERALREIYVRGFQIMIEESKPRTIMTSYNKINGVWGHYSYDLVETILRGEFGFDGLVVTDWWMRMADDPHFPALRDSAYRVRGGIDVLMPGSEEHGGDTCDTGVRDSLDVEEGLTLGELQRTALHVLRFILEVDPQGHATSAEKGRRNVM